jgi:hypothetical protein
MAALIDEKHDQVSTGVGLAHGRIEILTSHVTPGDTPKPWTIVENLFYFRLVYLMLLGQLVDDATQPDDSCDFQKEPPKL